MTLFSLNSDRRVIRRNFFIYIGVVIFCIVFGIVYESFSHGIVSYYMYLGFLVPLALGFIPYAALFFIKSQKGPNSITSNLYNAGVATLTVGCFFMGVLDIYGTTRDIHVIIYSVVGGTLLLTGIIFYVISLFKNKEKCD